MVAPTNNLSINPDFYFMHTLNCCDINGSDFVIFNQEIQSEDDLKIELSDFNIIFLSPIESQKNITIKAITVIALSTITAKGSIKVNASNKFISLGYNLHSHLANQIQAPLTMQVEAKSEHKITQDKLKEGVDKWKGQAIMQGLAGIYGAINAAQGRDVDQANDLDHALRFFNIPPTSPL